MKWNFNKLNNDIADNLRLSLKLPSIISRLLAVRNFSDISCAKDFLNNPKKTYDPFLLKDMDIAAERINRAIKSKEKICVFGDYDADGITATYIVYSFLKDKKCDVIFMLPDRADEGYGMNETAVSYFREQGITLIITVDTGITAFNEALLCKEYGIDLVITDHHEARDSVPEAYAVVDPHRKECQYPFKELAGVGVAFKLICAISEEDEEVLLSRYADVIALGTVADLASVLDENRYFIKRGIEKLNSSPNKGIEALGEKCGVKVSDFTSANLAYIIAPRINAAGRVDSPVKALKLLLQNDNARLKELAVALCNDNDLRRDLENRIFENAVCVIEADDKIKKSAVLVVAGEGWHQGVIGIVASKLVDRYNKPCVLLTVDGNEAKGSARSIKGFNILDAVCSCSEILTKFGGHALAAGIQLDSKNIDLFRKLINDYSVCAETAFELSVDLPVTSEEISLDTAKSILQLEPFGTDNPAPVFAALNVKLISITAVGGGNHLRLTAQDKNSKFNLMYFSMSRDKFPFDEGDIIDIAFSMSVNEWLGREKVTASVKDIRYSLNNLNIIDNSLPKKEHFVAAYRYIARNDARTYNLFATANRINEENINCHNVTMTELKLKIVLEVFDDLGVINADFYEDNVSLKINKLKEKVHLESSKISQKYGLFEENAETVVS